MPDELHESYIRIRKMLNAWETKSGGTDRFELTELKLKKLINERDTYKIALEQIQGKINIVLGYGVE